MNIFLNFQEVFFTVWHLSGCAFALDFSQEQDFPESMFFADFQVPQWKLEAR
jgi:hypothetical protein